MDTNDGQQWFYMGSYLFERTHAVRDRKKNANKQQGSSNSVCNKCI